MVVATALGGRGHHGQDRLEAVEHLDPELLFLDTQRHGPPGGVEVEADDVAHLPFFTGRSDDPRSAIFPSELVYPLIGLNVGYMS
jgi:hypothetical protein